MNEKLTMIDIVNYCKQYGFIFQGSEIYGGLANTWDYGPLGSRLKNNVKDAWRKKFIQENLNSYEVDADILMHPKVWEASGHVSSFSDPLIDCKNCKKRERADTLINSFDKNIITDKMTDEEMLNYIKNNNVSCPKCGSHNWTDIREFNLMFSTQRGAVSKADNLIYLRPETAQGEFVNFLNVQRTMRCKIPFGIGQIGKAFRNEITPGNFIFRTIEFEQMEHQLFCEENTDMEKYEYYKKYAFKFLTDLGIKIDHIRYHDHDKLAFYAKAACDIEYLFPIGWAELWGTHNRTNYDLLRHQEYSGTSMEYLEPDTGKKYIPYVIESSVGCDRMILALLCDSYTKETIGEDEVREVLKIHPFLAPYKVAVLPLIKKKHSDFAKSLTEKLNKKFMTVYDESGTIGKRYRRQDAIGTPFCITIDDETIEKNSVTIRERDTMKQTTLNINEIIDYIIKSIEF